MSRPVSGAFRPYFASPRRHHGQRLGLRRIAGLLPPPPPVASASAGPGFDGARQDCEAALCLLLVRPEGLEPPTPGV